MAFMTLIVLLVFILFALSALILIFIGSFVLQGFLSNMKNPWAGLILPAASFIFILFLSILVIRDGIYTALVVMCKGNIYTVIYLLIYFFFRRRRKKFNSTSQINIER